MAKKIGEETQVTLDLKTIGMIVGFVIMLAGMWYTLQADELIRQTIMDTQEDVEEIKETIDKIDQRLYEIQKNR
jgi:hypothetical protein